MTIHGLIILPDLVYCYLYRDTKRVGGSRKKYLSFYLCLNFVLSAWYAFWFYKGWQPLTEKFHFLDTFNFARFHFLRPLVIYVAFALGLKIIMDELKGISVRLFIFFYCSNLLLGCFNEEIIYQSKPSVKEFYAEELFTRNKRTY